MLAGTQLAHALGYWLVTPDAHARREDLTGSGHGYLAYAPAALALLSALALAGLAARLLEARRGLSGSRLAAAPFALLPPLSFALQEHLERLAHTGALPFATSLAPTFLVGLALQIPFALVAYVFARALLAVAEALGCALAERRPPRPGRPRGFRAAPVGPDLRRIPVLALGHAERGPPARL
jgi:hypothetical protein